MDGSEAYTTFGTSHPAPPINEYVLNPNGFASPLMAGVGTTDDGHQTYPIPTVDAAEAGALQPIPPVQPVEPPRVLQ